MAVDEAGEERASAEVQRAVGRLSVHGAPDPANGAIGDDDGRVGNRPEALGGFGVGVRRVVGDQLGDPGDQEGAHRLVPERSSRRGGIPVILQRRGGHPR